MPDIANDPTMASPSAAAGAVTRKPMHDRDLRLRGYRRDDGLWDIEGQLTDRRHYDSVALERGTLAAGVPVHDIRVCVTVDDDLVVQAVTATMQAVPFGTCPGALAGLDRLTGSTLGPGWRRQVEQHLGGWRGCTHVRELLMSIATSAYQTIPVWHAQAHGDVVEVRDGQPPRHLGQCTGWAFDGAVVARHYPQFARPKDSGASDAPPAQRPGIANDST